MNNANAILSIIEQELSTMRFGTVKVELCIHDGQVRWVSTTTTTRHNIYTAKKELKSEK